MFRRNTSKDMTTSIWTKNMGIVLTSCFFTLAVFYIFHVVSLSPLKEMYSWRPLPKAQPFVRLMFHRNVGSLSASELVLDVECTDIRTFGNGDYFANNHLYGQLPYRICFDYPVRPKRGNCIVYSFGISDDWSFDDDFAYYGCQVFSFDPTIGKEAHTRGNKIHFFPFGLSGPDDTRTNFLTLGAIMDRLNHSKETIDILKIDVEGSEFQVLGDSATLGLVASQVKQLTIEWHLAKTTGIRHLFKDKTGFQSFYVEPRVVERAAYLVESFVNSKFTSN